jgi:acetyl esterase/lipase
VHTAHPDGLMSTIPKGYLENSQSLRRSFAVEYRLSAGPPFKPANPFPTALIDTLAGYLYLVNMGFAEKDIIVSGNSAGANAVLAMTRYLVENRDAQPRLPNPPGSIILLSPWADVSESFEHIFDPQSSQVRFANHDWLAPPNAESSLYSATAFIGGDAGEAYRNPYISPVNRQLLGLVGSYKRTVSFKGYPRTFIDVGGFEVMLDQARRLRDVMVEDMGEEFVRYNEVDGEVHD